MRNGTSAQDSPPRRGGRPRKSNTNASTSNTQEHEQQGRSASQPSTRQHAVHDVVVNNIQTQTRSGRGRGRPTIGRSLAIPPQTDFRLPKIVNVNPSYAATTMSAARKRVNPTDIDGTGPSSFTHPRRHVALEEVARRHGNFNGNLDN